ncbi:PREDICTED: glycine N-methyltransferase [Ceratosolen solmsi marchali]|uniref:Glycine N-methyltransferase n=1 Tax=Ceratosolen solmsi marchali TaxID=326594 RepID=A0AAJ6YVH0_9HYME|nr:PREDICTED: glycine N-methyltransferase [Ceratosolen solmsi marchali]XP_011505081.1 PREDICTED: glycine N-methyltransferase [Ceratosolen solmsi marchali]
MDSAFQIRSLGAAAEGIKDQYADGIAAKVWEVFIGDRKQRKQNYKDFLVGLLKEKRCKRVLDIACGTGVDSMMLLEEGFEVVSVDASDKMLKYALKSRWERRKEKSFDDWIIEEANWLTLSDDVQHLIGDGFDAVICLGNSFAHMLDSFGDQREQRQALSHFERCVKPGGLLLIDHRNYDNVIKTGQTPTQCIYYNSKHLQKIVTSILYTNGVPSLITLEYCIKLNVEESNDKESLREFRLSYYPHRLNIFTDFLNEAFHGSAKHRIYGDFKSLEEAKDPGFYIHVLEKN